MSLSEVQISVIIRVSEEGQIRDRSYVYISNRTDNIDCNECPKRGKTDIQYWELPDG